MHGCQRLSLFACGLLLTSAALTVPAHAEEIAVEQGKKTLAQAVAAARTGDTIVLPAGTFLGSLKLPAGVSLRGAGYERTILDAGSQPTALALTGKGSRVEDLTVRTRGTSALAAEDAADIAVRRLRLLGGALGVRWKNVRGGRLENVIVADAPVGVSLTRVTGVAVVNCTIANASSIGLSLVDVEDSALFNNLVADAGTAVMLGGARRGLRVDYNLYRALFAGKVDGQVSRVSLGPWRDVSGGLDAHSVNLPVRFAAADTGDFRPVAALDWDPSRMTTADWGIPQLGDSKAPTTDIDGSRRVGPFGVGAYEAPSRKAPRPDGIFTIADDEGTKSAGVFRTDGTLVRYLFHNLPLKKGTYGFQLASRTQLGDHLRAGDYEVRVTESRLGWTYRSITGNAGVDSRREDTDQNHVSLVRFAPDGNLLLGNGWNERGENVRSRDLKTGKARWVFNGSADMYGLCVAADGFIWCLRAGGKDTYTLSKIDSTTGRPVPFEDARQGVVHLPGALPAGVEEMAGILYLADTKNNKVYLSSGKKPAFDRSFAVAAPAQPTADRKRKLLWLLSGPNKLVAVSAEGKSVAEFTGVKSPLGLAVKGDVLAVASAATGKIHFFNCSEPARLKALKTLGRGDGPYGPLLADRFHFQASRTSTHRQVSLALDAGGRVALRDTSGRVVVLNAGGKGLYASISQFGNKPTPAPFEGDTRLRVFDHVGRFSWWIDARAGRWEPDAYWGLPPGLAGGNPLLGCFSDGDKKFGIFHYSRRDEKQKNTVNGLLIVRFEQHIGRPVLLYVPGKNGWVVLRDTNNDGLIDSRDGEGMPVLDSAGKRVPWHLVPRWIYTNARGDIRSMIGTGPDAVGFVWKRTGLDREGVPVYSFGPDSLLRVKRTKIPSPYDFSKTEDVRNQSESLLRPDGTLVATFQFGHSPRGMAMSNSGATDLALFTPDGTMRWLRPMNDFTPIQGVKPMGRGFLTSYGHQAEWLGLDEDGLGLGNLGFPAAAHWTGMWVDHPDQYFTFTGNDGNLHVLVGDYMVNGTHWLTLHGTDCKKSRFPFTLGAGAARGLAFRKPQPFQLTARPNQPRVLVRKLNAPLPIDGDLAKWRKAGITPQILITPVTASGSIDGPKDCSAIVRLAYEGNNLYVQVLRFDDVVTFHQPVSKSHLQDTVEIMLNGFMEGFQWSVSNFTDAGPAMVRRRFYFQNLQALTPAAHAPRVIKVLDNARTISERSLLEAAYGIDMADCKVIVTEFKLPIDRLTYRGSEGALFPVRSGSTFWLGFLISDNDVPGTDVQDLLVWPASFGTFNPKEDGALAIFE